MGRLHGKSCLVTGAARGIGLACARAFIAEGASVLLTDIRDELVAAETGKLWDQARYRRLDVRSEADWDAAIADLAAWRGGVDVVVNNAGITGFDPGPDGSIPAHDPEHASLTAWRAVHETNLDGVFLGCRAAIRAMRTRGTGSIINMSSRSGVVGIPGAAAYASSKAAVRNHTKTVALYCAEQGLKVRCNSVHPGAILTPMWEAMLGEGAVRAQNMRDFTADTPLGRFGTPEEVAALVVYLASDESAYTTGAEFTIDGGILAGTAVRPRATPDDGVAGAKA